MTTFDRNFDVDAAEKALHAREVPWFGDLLRYWWPAGDAPGQIGSRWSEPMPQADHLRIAVRNGYLNLYRGGQSVAKVTFDSKGKLQAEIHKKYVYGKDAGGKQYVKLGAAGVAGPDGTPRPYRQNLVHDWILNANNYTDAEKCFVDEIVARNPGVIDLEAGLPADPEIWDKSSAPRMDLVALECCGNRYRLVFWEAKLVTNPEARCRTGAPRVIDQLEKYAKWVAKHEARIREAYQRNCAILLRLHGIAKALNPNIGELGNAIAKVAGQDPSQLAVDTRPRLVIDDSSENASFTESGHLEKLRQYGIHVQMIRSASEITLSARASA